MKLFRNDGERKWLFLYIGMGVAATAAAFFFSPRAAGVTAALACLYLLFYVKNITGRYRQMADLVQDLNRILHGTEDLDLSRYTEGELALLRSELRKMTVRLQKQGEMLQRDKEILADFMADIAHQVRTPLTSLNLLSATLRSGNLSEEERTELLREMARLLERIDWLVSTQLKMAKLDAGTVTFESRPVTFAELIGKAAQPLAIPMELKGQSLKTELSGGFTGDLQWAAEAVSNMLKNCMEHMEAGGSICASASENALYSELVIRDTGCGFDEADLPHLFERFYRGKGADSQSVGIGLAFAKTVIGRMNGTVEAENHSAGGAVFRIRFYKGVV